MLEYSGQTNFHNSLTKLDRTSVSETILNMITESILSGSLKPGDKLPTELEFVNRLGVGRNSVREAMKMLSSLGVTETRRGSGTYIAQSYSGSVLNPLILSLAFEQGTTKEMIELRLAIETCAAELAVENATAEDIERIEEKNSKLKEANEKNIRDSHILRDLDLDVHFTLFEITHNSLFEKIAKTVYRLFFASLEKSIQIDLANSYNNHKLYIDAIKNRDIGHVRTKIKEGLSFWRDMMSK
jgi:DNA-binding FadR family transcriptional regulator